MIKNKGIFSKAQWAVALAVAVLLHLALAWWLLSTPWAPATPSFQRGEGFTLERASLDGADLPLLEDANSSLTPLPAITAAPLGGEILQPAPPQEARPMIEVAPGRLSPEPIEKQPAPRAEPTLEKDRRTRQAAARKPSTGSAAAPGGEAAGARDAKKGQGSVAAAGARRGVDRAARPLGSNRRPEYPFTARRRGHEGQAVIRARVLDSGRVGSASVSRSSGHAALDQAAVRAIKRWRFHPALRAGSPVASTVEIPVDFSLKD